MCTIVWTILQVLVKLYALIFIKNLYVLPYFFILSVNLKLVHLVDPIPSVFISLFIIIIFGGGCMAGRLLQRAVQKQLVCLINFHYCPPTYQIGLVI